MRRLIAFLTVILVMILNIQVAFATEEVNATVSLPLQNTTVVHELVVTDITYNLSNDWVQFTLKDNDNFMLASNTDWVTGTSPWHWKVQSDQLTDITIWISGSNLVVRGYYSNKTKVPYLDISYCYSGNLSVADSYLSTGGITNGIQYYEIYDRAFIEFTEYVIDGSGSSNTGDDPIIGTEGHQQWVSFPESPILTSDFKYQAILSSFDDAQHNLFMSDNPIYYSGSDSMGLTIRSISSIENYYTDSGHTDWTFASRDVSQATYTDYNSYWCEANNDIYTDANCVDIAFSETSIEISYEAAHFHDVSVSSQISDENTFRFNGLVDSTECPNNLLVSFTSSVPTQFLYTYTSDYDSYKIYHYKVELASDIVGTKDVDITMKYAGEEVYTETFTINNTKQNIELDDYLSLKNDYGFKLEFVDADIYYETDFDYVLKITNHLSGSFTDPLNPQNDFKVYARALRNDGSELVIPVQDNWCDGQVDGKDVLFTKMDMTFATHILPETTDPALIADGEFFGWDDQISKVFIRYDQLHSGRVVDSDLIMLDYKTLLEFIMKYDEYNIKEPGFATGQWEFTEGTDFGWNYVQDEADGHWEFGEYGTIDEYHWKDNSDSEGITSWVKEVYGVEDVAWTTGTSGEITMNPSNYIKEVIANANNGALDIASAGTYEEMKLKAGSFAAKNWPVLLIGFVVVMFMAPKGSK